MNVLITGNLGYVGDKLTKYLFQVNPNNKLIGFDMGYFKDCLTNSKVNPETLLEKQYFGDLRKLNKNLLQDIDAIIHLGAISNDPIGNEYGEVTIDVNYKSSINLAKAAKENGIKTFVFASSCSIYGNGTNTMRTEDCELSPLTNYAISKVNTEKDLKNLADDNFKVTVLRFATACGMSDRLRLDLVLNDFVASAIANKYIEILSDGTPWRPLIDVNDMAVALEWALNRPLEIGGEFTTLNVGDSKNNYTVLEIAESVKNQIKDIDIIINPKGEPDKRSYRVDFSLYSDLAPQHKPKYDLEKSVFELVKGLNEMKFSDKNFRQSNLTRLNKLRSLKRNNLINEKLEWVNSPYDHK